VAPLSDITARAAFDVSFARYPAPSTTRLPALRGCHRTTGDNMHMVVVQFELAASYGRCGVGRTVCFVHELGMRHEVVGVCLRTTAPPLQWRQSMMRILRCSIPTACSIAVQNRHRPAWRKLTRGTAAQGSMRDRGDLFNFRCVSLETVWSSIPVVNGCRYC